MRPSWLVDPEDVTALHTQEQYLMGSDLLVAPVLHPETDIRTLYLPPGRWRDYWTGQTYSRPGTLTVAAPTQRIPLFTRLGTPLTMRPPATLELPATLSPPDHEASPTPDPCRTPDPGPENPHQSTMR